MRRTHTLIMMCYKDMVFCAHSKDCSNNKCHRNFTQEEREKAIKWWGSENFPIAYSDLRDNGCGFLPKENMLSDNSKTD